MEEKIKLIGTEENLIDILNVIYDKANNIYDKAIDAWDAICGDLDNANQIAIAGEQASSILRLASEASDKMIRIASLLKELVLSKQKGRQDDMPYNVR